MRTIRSLRNRIKAGSRLSGGDRRRRLARAWRDLADLPRELSREVTRRYAPVEPQPVPVPVPIRR